MRLVIADHEEDGGSGDYAYADYIAKAHAAGNFKAIAAVDFDQSGWVSPKNDGKHIDIYLDQDNEPQWLTDDANAILSANSPLIPNFTSLGGAMVDSDFLAYDGIPGVCPSEVGNATNPYKDVKGDTLDIITKDYYFLIARFDVAYLAKVVGITL